MLKLFKNMLSTFVAQSEIKYTSRITEALHVIGSENKELLN